MVDSASHEPPSPEHSADNPFLTIRQLVWGFFGAIVVGGFSTSLLWESIQLTLAMDNMPSGVSSLIMLLGIQAGMAIFAWSTLRHAGVNIGQLMGAFPLRYNWIAGVGWAIALIVFTFSFMATLAYGAVALFPDTIAEVMTQLFTTLAQEDNPFWISVCMAMMGTIVAPLVEEFTFRGLFFHCWSARYSLKTGLLLTAALFASLHPQNFVGMFVFSLVLSLLYLRTRSLWVPIGIHAIYNGIIFTGNLLSVATDNSTGSSESPEVIAEQAVSELLDSITQARFGISAVLFLAIASFIVFRMMYRSWPQQTAPLPYFQNCP